VGVNDAFGNPYYSDASGPWAGNLTPSHLSPHMLPGGANPWVRDPFDGGASAGQAALGHLANSPISAIIMQISSMLGHPITPMGNSYGPAATAMYYRQQQDLASLQGMTQQMDVEQLRAMLARMTGPLMGDTVGAPTAMAQAALGVLNNPAVSALGAQNVINRFANMGFGGTSQQMANAIYSGTRHLQMTPEEVGRVTGVLGGAYMPYTDGGGLSGVSDRVFTQGLNRGEIGETIASMSRNFVLDFGMSDSGMVEFSKKANAMVSSLKDLFGRDKPITQLFQNLQELTQGGLQHMDASQLQGLVDRLKSTTAINGLRPELMLESARMNAMFARQLGMPGVVGVDIATDIANQAGGVMAARSHEDVWGQWDYNEMTNYLTMSRHAMYQSPGMSGAGGVLRLARRSKNAGVQELAAKIRNGQLTDEDMQNLSNPTALAERFGQEFSTSEAASAFFSDQLSNSQYFEHVDTSAITRGRLRQSMADAISRSSSLINSMAGSSQGDVRNRATELVAAINGSSSQDQEGRIKAMAAVLGDDVGLAREVWEQSSTFLRGTSGISQYDAANITSNASAKAQEARAAQAARLAGIEQVIKATGVGANGPLGERISSLLGSTAPVSMDQFLKGVFGAPDALAMQTLGKALGKDWAPSGGLGQLHEDFTALHAAINEYGADSPEAKAAAEKYKSTSFTVLGEGGEYKPEEYNIFATRGEQARVEKTLGHLKYIEENFPERRQLLKEQVGGLRRFLDSDAGGQWLKSRATVFAERSGMSSQEVYKQLLADLKGLDEVAGSDHEIDVTETRKRLTAINERWGGTLSNILHQTADGKLVVDTRGTQVAAQSLEGGMTANTVSIRADVVHVEGKEKDSASSPTRQPGPGKDEAETLR